LNHKVKGLTSLLLASFLATTGCSSSAPEESSKGKEAKSPEIAVSTAPVTLKLFVNAVRLSKVDFEKFFVEPLKKKHPNITIEMVFNSDGSIAPLEKLIVAGDIPDLIMSDTDWHMPLKQLDLPMDLTDMVKKFNLDLSTLNPVAVQTVQNLQPGQLQAVPFFLTAGVLFYNKDLFDKFGVPYPKDDMQWPEVMNVARTMTRMQDGVQYIGIDLRFPDHVVSPYTQPFIDPKTNKALVDIPLYRKVLDLFDQMYKMPGFVSGTKYAYGPDGFVKDKYQAMQPDWSNKIISDLLQAEADGIAPNWDMVTNPTFEDKVGKGRHTIAAVLAITKGSKHKEQAMQVIQMMVSREQQMLMSKESMITILNDNEVKKAYGTSNPLLKNKNTAALFKNPPTPTPPAHIADKEVQTVIRAMRKEMAIGKKDINTVLREGQEQADKKIAALMAK
jgi:multiple sugar transport system substrate-binding protein